MKAKTILTHWEVRTYDVWGNKDGYWVNNKFVYSRDYVMRLKVRSANTGTEREFNYASPSTYQLQSLFSVRCAIDRTGDDISIYVNHARDYYPLGELYCISHESLSPIREKV